jgi:hypothetical protein
MPNFQIGTFLWKDLSGITDPCNISADQSDFIQWDKAHSFQIVHFRFQVADKYIPGVVWLVFIRDQG